MAQNQTDHIPPLIENLKRDQGEKQIYGIKAQRPARGPGKNPGNDCKSVGKIMCPEKDPEQAHQMEDNQPSHPDSENSV